MSGPGGAQEPRTADVDEPDGTAPDGTTPGGTAPGGTAPGGTASDDPAAHRTARGPRARLEAGWVATPLRTRLAATTAVLLGVGLLVAGVTSLTLLRGTLMNQLDAKLTSEGRSLAQESVDALQSYRDIAFPSDYYVLVRASGLEEPLSYPNTIDTYGTPVVPDLTPAQIAARGGAAYTAASDQAGSRWRMVTYLLPEADGSVTVALPQRDVDLTVKDTARRLVVSGAAIVVLGVLAGAWAVRRSLRPLREIEATAAAIAAGDLSRRVPSAPASTEVGRLGEALNGMLTQIENAFDARTASEARMRRFVADASHELRTPLAAVRGYAELYRMGAMTTDEQVTDTMRRIEGSATRMGSLVEDLLALARLDEGRGGSTTGPVDLTVLAADAVSDLRALDPGRPVRLEALGGVTAPRVVVGDEARLRQVLANLVGNAVRHTPAGSPVEVAVGAGPDHGTALLEVRDHGPGIAPEHAERVFERFYRVDPSRTRDSGGSGLGMAIVAAIVGSHGGRVAVVPTPGGGATVRVVLPVDGPPASGPRPPGASPTPDVATMSGPSSPS